MGEGGEARVGRTKGKMEQVIDNKGEQDKSTHDHMSGSKGRLYHIFPAITLGPRALILDREPNGVVDMQQNDDDKKDANDPEEWAQVTQVLSIAIDPCRAEKDLEVAQEMTNNKENQDNSGRGHNDFPAD